MNNAGPIFEFLAATPAGQNSALVTVVDSRGGSTRNPGAHMGVRADRSYVGSLSGGCIEAAVITEALAAIDEGKPRQVRFGAGSPFFDIRLPCGGSIDLLITPLTGSVFAAKVRDELVARRPVELTLPFDATPPSLKPGPDTPSARIEADRFVLSHVPMLRLLIIGHGAAVDALQAQAQVFGAETSVITPDEPLTERLKAKGAEVHKLTTPSDIPALRTDKWTAVLIYFHDHDWEPNLLTQALNQPHFFIGAMGSRKTHMARKEALAARGVDAAKIDSIVSPIGLIPSSRDPETMGLSTLVQVVAEYDKLWKINAPQDVRGDKQLTDA